jgi:hypothetical protein
MLNAKLYIEEIVRFSSQFADFFRDPDAIVAEDWFGAGKSDEPWGKSYVFAGSPAEEAWGLLWNNQTKEFLLLHYVESKARWFYRFAPDSKGVLRTLKLKSQIWRSYFNLVHLAHMAAYGNPEHSDRQFLERMMTEALFKATGVESLRREAERSAGQIPPYVAEA